VSAGALAAVRAAIGDREAWLVGGAVRDRLLDRVPAGPPDLDVVVAGDPEEAARALARAQRAAVFPLSESFGAWRVIGPGRAWQVDLAPLRGDSLEADLRVRDFTVNALAEPLGGGPVIDPFGGAGDLAARRLRMVTPQAFELDALRPVRLARLAAELGFDVDRPTAAAARLAAPALGDVPGERVFGELSRLLLTQAAVRGLVLLDDLALTEVVLPEVAALHGVQQSAYHHRDVHGHTLEVLQAVVDLERDPTAALGAELAAGASALLSEPLADGLTRGGALRLGALLHDVAKPATQIRLPGGRIGFPGHDREGAEMARAVLRRLRTSVRLQSHVADLTRHHLRLGFLVHRAPLDRRGVHEYLVACGAVAADVTLLTVADRLATRGRKADEAIARHLELARELLAAALAERARGRREPLVRGDELAAELGMAPGPPLGRLLAELEAAAFAGEIRTREEAIAHARRALAAGQAASAREAERDTT
jgi:putative nucleotidyltransferase with HDIG domain